MNLEIIMLREISQTQKRQKVEQKLPRMGEDRTRRYCSTGSEIIWDDGKVLKMDTGDGCITL